MGGLALGSFFFLENNRKPLAVVPDFFYFLFFFFFFYFEGKTIGNHLQWFLILRDATCFGARLV